MRDALNFVKGAVARKDFVPALQHFRLAHGFIRSFNGTLGLCSPIACDLDCAPRAEQLVRAIDSCQENNIDVTSHGDSESRYLNPVALTLTDKGRLLVRSGDFKTFVDTTDPATFPPYDPQGIRTPITDSLLPALRYLEPFITEDASRQWACGILFQGQSAFATNNVVLQEYWLGFNFPCRVNVPAAAIRELLRIGQDPIAIQLAEESDDNKTGRITFHFPNNRWLTAQLYESKWPDTESLLDRESNQKPFPAGFFDVLERLMPFTDDLGRVYFLGDRIATHSDSDAAGTTIDLPGVPPTGCFNARQLLRLKEVATTIDFESYPEPSIFYGGAARGLICGLRS